MNFREAIFSLIVIMVAFLPVTLFPEEIVHTVQRGDTIFSIARSFSVDRDELMRVNGITDPTKLQAGQRLKIPKPASAAAENLGSGGEIIYRAVRGDTFYSIARKYGATVNQILSANSLSSDYVLKQGDMLRIPGTSVAGTSVQGTPVQGTLVQGTSVPQTQALNGASSSGTTAVPSTTSVPRPTEARALDQTIRWPVTAKELNYLTGNGGGVVITGERAEPVKSLTNGTVISAGPYRGYGRVAIVQAAGGYIYVYGGCEILTVREGDKVGPGMEMGRLGIDAITEKPQLFFRVYLNNTPVDPAKAPRV